MPQVVIAVTRARDVPLAPMDGKPTLVYWKIHGLGLAVRLTLAVALEDADWVDVQLEAGRDPQDPSYRQVWIPAKENYLPQVLDFPNLPYYLDDQVQLTQTDTILRYLGRKYALMGVTGQEYVVDLVLDQVKDVEATLVSLHYVQGRPAWQRWLEDVWPTILSRFDRLFHEPSKTYLTGNRLSIADLKLYALVHKMTAPPSFSCQLPAALSAWYQRVEALPAVQAFWQQHTALPMNLASALVGGDVNF